MLLENDPDPIRNTRQDVSEELEQVVMRCLAKRIEERWSSVGELAVALAPFASRSSRVHVERAGRVLGVSAPMTAPPESALQSSEPPPPMPPTRAGTGPGLGGGTPTQASVDSLPLPPDSSATHDSWGRTQRPHMEQVQKRPAGSPPSWQWFVIGGAVLLSLAVAVFALRGSAGARPETASDGAPVLAPKDPALPAVVPAEVPAAAVEPPSTEPAGASGSNVAASGSAKAEPARPGDTTADLAKRQPLRPPAPLPPRPKPSSSSGLTDFGGRR
jgi:hypothetical protein